MQSGEDASGGLERWYPRRGRAVGTVLVVVLVLAGVLAAAAASTPRGWGIAVALLTLAWGCVLLYVRPELRAHPDHLQLRNPASDTAVPWHLLDAVQLKENTCRVEVGTRTWYGPGAGLPPREKGQRSRRRVSLHERVARWAEHPVARRLETLATERADASRGRTRVETRRATVEVAALAGGALLALVLVVLG